MAYRVLYPSLGWLRVIWPEKTPSPAGADAIAEIPGCQAGDRYVEIPHTAWMLEAVDKFLFDANCPPPPPLNKVVTEFQPVRPLFEHQKSGVAFALSQRGVLIADDMGLGKTAEAAVAAESVRRVTDRPGLIVAPLFARETWRGELLALGIIKRPEELYVLSGRLADAASQELRQILREQNWFFVHYDVVLAWWNKLMLLHPRHPVVAIVDEAHWVRNSQTQRAKGTLSSAGCCEHKILLTGTPLDSRLSELWFPLTLATGTRTWGGPLDFRKRYAGAFYNGYGHEDGEPTNSEELKLRMAPFFLRRTATDAGLELPELIRSSVVVDLDEKQKLEHHDALAAHGATMEDLVYALLSGSVEKALPVFTALRKVTGWAKARATIDQVRNALDQGESVVVFTWERRIAAAIADALPRAQSYLVTGNQDQEDRTEIVEAFQASVRPTALVATYGCLREGVTLHRARIVVLHDLGLVLSELLQAEKRIHRIGQTRVCNAIWMLADKTIDSILAPLLLRKAAMQGTVLSNDAESIVASAGLADLGASGETIDEQVERVMSAWRGA